MKMVGKMNLLSISTFTAGHGSLAAPIWWLAWPTLQRVYCVSRGQIGGYGVVY